MIVIRGLGLLTMKKKNLVVAILKRKWAQVDVDQLLDELGVPTDNSGELFRKFGSAGFDRPEMVCRDMFTDRWFEIVEEGNEKDIEDFPDWVKQQLDRISGR